MAVLSSLRRFLVGGGLGNRMHAADTPPSSRIGQVLARVGIRHGSGGGAGAGGAGRRMVVKQSEYNKRRVLDELHYQVCLVSIPFLTVIFISNVIIGNATLTEIPEGYEPECWEYYKSPITRFWARYLHHPEPVRYEIDLSQFHQWELIKERRAWEKKCKELMKDRQDYKAWFFIPYDSYPLEKANAIVEDTEREQGSGTRGFGGRLVESHDNPGLENLLRV